MGLFEQIIVLKEIGNLIDNLIARSPDEIRKFLISNEQRKAIREAMTTLEDAIDSTQKHINTKGYVKAPELVKKWQNSLDKLVEANIGKNLPEYLWHKIDFWKNPEASIRNEDKIEHTPTLDLLREKCKALLNLVK